MRARVTTLLIFLSAPLLLSIFACNKEAQVLYFRVLDVFLSNGIESDSNFRGYNDLQPNDEISYLNYRLILGVGVEYFSEADVVPFDFFAPRLLPGLMANGPGDPIASEELESISIVSNFDLTLIDGTVIPSGSSLNEYFVTSVDEMSQNMNVNQYLEWAQTPKEQAVLFKLLEAPDKAQTHQFNVWYKIKGVRNFSTTADPIVITD